ncbi:MAG: 16S rRNA (cytosine(1402)-N(4))-methyltransferase [Bacteroidetes bacterium B1(2017)]|nr:MAG: 16S rRNA (cytosine(1402)-N(4))-methyltransferase [Bacteroidetes bacterium B1(2017)]
MEPQEEPKPKRRVRYSGTHPKTFKEKYKELNPELYSEDVQKVMQQGRTPAGMHRSICVDEILEVLHPAPGEVGLDATLGYGGHTLELLKCIQPGGKLFSIDVDPIELPRTKERLEKLGFGEDKVVIQKMNFSEIDMLEEQAGLFNFVLADLGVSSMQIDNPDRGFSFKIEGPLDLRLNPKSGKPVSEYLKSCSAEFLEELFLVNSDEPHAARISTAIVEAINRGRVIETTTHLYSIIEEALSFLPASTRKDELKKACQRCFQALRIAVNDEFGVLESFLEKLPYALAPGARVVILTFHSGEDRRVKKAFQALYRQGVYSAIAQEPMRPSAQEIFSNPRAKSTKLRWAIKA